MPRLTRRTFLQQAAVSVGASCAVPIAQPSIWADEKPRPRKYAICNETFGKWPQKKIFQFAAECGYGSVEIAPFTINNDVTQVTGKQRSQLRQQADRAHVQIAGLHWLLAKTKGLHLTSPDAEVRRKTAEYLGELAKFCSDLGGRIMVFGSPKQRSILPGVRREDATQFAADLLRHAMPTLAQRDVVLALEPLAPKTTNFLRTAAEAVELAKRVDSPHCRLLLDCYAMATEAVPIPQLIRRYGDWLVHFHANDPNRRGPGMGDLDFTPIFQALNDVQFDGWVSVEVFDVSPGPERLARESIAYMKKVDAGLS